MLGFIFFAIWFCVLVGELRFVYATVRLASSALLLAPKSVGVWLGGIPRSFLFPALCLIRAVTCLRTLRMFRFPSLIADVLHFFALSKMP